MNATDILRHEHQIITMVLDGADAVVTANEIHPEVIEQMVDFFRTFADGCHHMKEEKYLFPKLIEKGMSPVNGPVAVMLSEHDAGRMYLKGIAGALPGAKAHNPDAAASIRTGLRNYSAMLRAHIAKENTILFPLSDSILTPAEQSELAAAFERLETEEMGPGVHERYHQFAHDLKKAFLTQE